MALAAALLALTGCQSRDPYLRTDVWQPTGANAGNIAAMVANPADLIAGHGAPGYDSQEPVLAVGHVWADQPKTLGFGGGGGGGGSSGGSGGGSGGGSSGGGGSGS